ncbi:class I SAM-dependent methyltransferase [Cellulosimicrobium cellulans]|uniref:class I SAM-dependent methyltransferase n=1 Tax=Cellulosimicrobium cellulans TaxID=1710 RepID=UPI0008487627|nr:class I SAM-dependent methyltransferase [Cellulosimicrobium cellulans]
MGTADRVREHYAGDRLAERILDAAAVGDGVAPVDALAPFDELHVGGLPATLHVLGRLDLDAGTALLDVGSGVGGPARVAADRHGCTVTGVDLSPDFVAAARTLTEYAGLTPLARFEEGDAGRLPCDDASQDRAMMIHVGMNVPDKAAVFAELRRVVRPGGLVAVHDQMRVGPGDLPYPLPWDVDDGTSFVEPPAAYTDGLAAAGFEVLDVEDRSVSLTTPDPQAADDLSAVYGPAIVERRANLAAASQAGTLAPVLVLARA